MIGIRISRPRLACAQINGMTAVASIPARMVHGGFVPVLTFFALALTASACALSPPPPAPEPAAESIEVYAPFDHPHVWTSQPGTRIEQVEQVEHAAPEEADPLRLEPAFLRLEVLGRDSIGLRVRCQTCPGTLEGTVAENAVVHTPLPPGVAAWAEIGDFALAIRAAAARRDFEALRPVMAPDFTFAFLGEQNPDAAFEVWRSEGFRTLDRMLELLDQGVTSRDGRIWSAPPAFVEEFGYQGVRAGFRRDEAGRWEWLYLVRGVLDPDA